MFKNIVADGTIHKTPIDLQKALLSTPAALTVWNSLTPLARNEWICWNTNVKQLETRQNHIKRTITELQQVKRRPCCWLGCSHRTDTKINATQQWLLDKRSKAR